MVKELNMEPEVKQNKILSKILLLLIKYIPIVQLIIFFINNILYCFINNNAIAYTLDFIFGNSIITFILLYIISYRFNYCIWHRIIITNNLINVGIAYYDASIGINCSNTILFLIYTFVTSISIIVSSYTHIKQVHNERKIKNA